MSTCKECGGLIAEANKIYGLGGKICHCMIPKRTGYFIPDDFQEKVKQQAWQPKITPKFIIDQCEKLSLEEVKALIALLSAYYDCAMISAHPGGFKKREANE